MTAQRFPSHPAQRGLIAAAGSRRDIGANCGFMFEATGPLDPRRLLGSYRDALARFDALRMALVVAGPLPAWHVGGEPRVVLRMHPSPQGVEAAQQQVMTAAHDRLSARFDLSSGPIGSIDLFRTPAGTWVVVEAFDHAVADGHSLVLLHAAVSRSYAADGAAEPVAGRYSDLLFVASGDDVRSRSVEFWRDCYAGFDATRIVGLSPCSGGSGHQRQLILDAAEAARLGQVAARARATVAGTLFAAHAHAVARHSGRGDIAAFVALDTRDPTTEEVFGQATNLVPVRVTHRWARPLGPHIAAVTRQLLAVREYLAIDVDDLDRVGAPVKLSAPDATAFVFQDRPTLPPRLPGIVTAAVETPDLHDAGGLTTVVHRNDDGALTIRIRMPGGSALAPHMDGIVDTVRSFLDAVASGAACRLGDDELLSKGARTRIRELAEPADPYPFAPVERLILRNLAAAPTTTALVEHGRALTAGELRAAIIARSIALRRDGVAVRQAVLVDEASAFDRIASFLALLRIGAVYLPIDATTPVGFADEIAKRSHAVARMSSGVLHRLRPDSPPAYTELSPEDPAYVIFTSGTTGSPKGVVISRAALSNLAQGEGPRFGVGPGARVLLIAPPTTDPWICHVTGTLAAGATLVAADMLGAAGPSDVLEYERITHAFLPAAIFSQLEPRAYPDLLMVATAGDHCRPESVARMLPRRIVNIYGPTEATVTSTIAELPEATAPIPIGRPIRGLGGRVVIDGQATAPPGVVGELVISGAGLAIGYLGDAAATASSFAPDALRPGHRRYSTGDRAWLGDDGQFYLDGRADRQVRIRGFRVELGHVEAAARASGLCGDAHAKALTAPGTHDRHLVLYAQACPRPDALDAWFRATLPPALRPRRILPIARLPRHPSGKVDESGLPAADAASTSDEPFDVSDDHGTAARLLASVWQRVLGALPHAEDNFFAIGGDSLDVLRLIRDARAVGLALAPTDVYRHSTFAGLAARAVTTATVVAGTAVPTWIPLGPSQEWFFGLALPEPDRWSQRHRIAFAELPSETELAAALTALIARTPILSAHIDATGIRYTPSDPPPITFIDLPASDDELAIVMADLHGTLEPAHGTHLRAAALRSPDGSGHLILVAHHLVVDDWSWRIVEDRIRAELSATASRESDTRIDNGYAQFSLSIAAQRNAGAFHLDGPAWSAVIKSGATCSASFRPTVNERISSSLHGPAAMLAAKWAVGLPAVLLGCVAHALAGREPGPTVVDLERNGRSAVTGLDLSAAVGWFALHHPIVLMDAPLDHTSATRIAASLDAPPNDGLSYGALLATSSIASNGQCGRFAVNIAESNVPDDAVGRQLRRCTPLSGTNLLPYEATVTFRLSRDAIDIELVFDPSRLSRAAAAHLLSAIAAAPHDAAHRPGRHGPPYDPASVTVPTTPADEPFSASIPAGAMQQLMLDRAAFGPGIYRPRMILEIDGLPADSRPFLNQLSRQLGTLDPFRRRFRTDGGLVQELRRAEPVPIELRTGGAPEARRWIAGPDVVDAQAARHRGALAAFVAFTAPGEPLRIALQVHHAIMDGPSIDWVLGVVDHLAHANAAPPPAEFSAVALRKHIGAEQLLHGGPGGQHPESSPTMRQAVPTTLTGRLTTDQVAELGAYASANSVDLRALVAGAVILIARRKAPDQPVYLVANGRDPDLPETDHALGLFWYFQPVPTAPSQNNTLASLAATVFALASTPVRDVRAAAMDWRSWPSDQGLALNIIKEQPAARALVRVVAATDIFHFPEHVEVSFRMNGSATIRWTCRDPETGRAALAALLDVLRYDWNRKDGGS